jgi:outer membrane lipoprotein SlyB
MNAMTAGSSGATGGGWSSMMTGGLSGMLPGGLGGSSMSNLSNITGTAPPAKPASTAANHGQATEFTLRMDDGSTQTVVLGDAQGLHTGDRVEVVRGDKTSLVHVS